MNPIRKRWRVAARITAEAERELQKYPPVIRQILFNRGYPTCALAEEYLNALPPSGTDPFQMTGMDQAVGRILEAVEAREPIVIYGDYDVDGVTAAALLVTYLKDRGAKVRPYIPNRFDEGYGLNLEALAAIQKEGAGLVVTVDCGIRSLAEAEYARSQGLDLIISDHHQPGEVIPAALAVIDPKQPGDPYPEKDLAGVGLAYKIAAAIDQRRPVSVPPADDYLDLVALGTVADLAPLVGENRYLVRGGLQQIHLPQRQGVMSLIGAAGLNPKRITATDLGFVLGPRLNAAGRVESAQAALELLLSREVSHTSKLAQQLENQNRARQKIMHEMQEQAEALAMEENPGALLLVALHPEFNAGVVGLAASRLSERFYRPAIVGKIEAEFTRASCRSIPEFHITAALDHCADLLEHHGGHAAAAGFTVRNENLPELLARLAEIAEEQLAALELRPALSIDAEIPLKELEPELLEYLEQLQPTGYGNPSAVFVSRGVRVTQSRTVGRDQSHLKMSVLDGGMTYDAIAFRQGHWQSQMPARIDLAYSFELNEFNGRVTLQLNVRDMKPSGEPD